MGMCDVRAAAVLPFQPDHYATCTPCCAPGSTFRFAYVLWYQSPPTPHRRQEATAILTNSSVPLLPMLLSPNSRHPPPAALLHSSTQHSPTNTCIARAGSVVVRAAAAFAPRDASQRIVITGMGIASCFGNDVDTFYDR